MSPATATAIAHPNIAFIKYWGNRDHDLRIPSNGSLSMNLAGLETRTRVEFDPALARDELKINDIPAGETARQRVSTLLNRVRTLASISTSARVTSSNNFPTGSGIASSASAFAALAVAASAAARLNLDEAALSRLARTGSGSASRSVPAGFAEWFAGEDDLGSYAASLAPPDHWPLVDLVVIVSRAHKETGSTGGHRLADSSPLQAARLLDAPRRLDLCRATLLQRDFAAFAAVVEQDSLMMHSVMMTSNPPLLYWLPATLGVIQAVMGLRRNGLAACTTIDAGPNVHVLTLAQDQPTVLKHLRALPGVEDVLVCSPGGGAHLVTE